MLSILLGIWLVHTAILISPGVNFILLSQLTMSSNNKTAIYAVWGICTGTFVWACSAILGVHALFLLFPQIRLALQVIGAGYLLFVAYKLWRSASSASKTVQQKNPNHHLPLLHLDLAF